MRRKFKIPTVNIAATAYTIMDDADKNFKHAKLYVNPNPVKDSVDYHCDVTNYIIALEYEDEKHEEVAKLLNSLTQIYEKEGYKLEDYEIKSSTSYDWKKLLKEVEPKEEVKTTQTEKLEEKMKSNNLKEMISEKLETMSEKNKYTNPYIQQSDTSNTTANEDDRITIEYIYANEELHKYICEFIDKHFWRFFNNDIVIYERVINTYSGINYKLTIKGRRKDIKASYVIEGAEMILDNKKYSISKTETVSYATNPYSAYLQTSHPREGVQVQHTPTNTTKEEINKAWYDQGKFTPGVSAASVLSDTHYDRKILQEVSIRLDLLKKLIDKLTPMYEEEGCLADLKEEVAGIVQELSSILEG